MCLEERKTDSRGRPPLVPASERRTRCLRRSNWFSLRSMTCASLLLAFLALDVLALVADTLALVGLRLARGPDHGGHLADLLLVDARYRDDLLLGAAHLHLDAGRDRVDHVVAEADLQLQGVLALERDAEAGAMDLQRVRIALGDAVDQIDDLGAGHAPHGAGPIGLLARGDLDAGGSLLHLDVFRAGEAELALGTLHGHLLAGHRRRHTRRDGDRLLAYARHCFRPLEHVAEDLAAHVLFASARVRHHALGRRQDGHAQAVGHVGEIAHCLVDAPTGLGHPLDLADRRLAVGVLELDLELGEAVLVVDTRVAADIALIHQHVEHPSAQVGSRRGHLGSPTLLRIANAGEHIAERIVHCVALLPYQLDFTMPGIRPWLASSRSMLRHRRSLR